MPSARRRSQQKRAGRRFLQDLQGPGPTGSSQRQQQTSGAREDAWDTSNMASPTLIVLFTVFECVALLFIVLGVPLMRAKASLNIPSRFQSITMARESAEWRAVNAAAGRDLVAIGV